ncbi:hypothetical protein BDW02DRAFT_574777 [Decorospora gaudefroyi]|uniref:Uncharacterized protein n=1 Tax=Decorospora gaudefroyi TaxID=184978 RepID=A0A6A5JWY0_9PLEO|nr:hypothetical protein BDW02DRAFT_574777 [Decorospora gaudefroyi]
MNANGFRKKQFDTNALRVRAAQEAANEDGFHPIQDMAIVDPKVRASAADMLDKLFNGEERSTPRDRMQSAPEVDKNAAAPRKERKHRIKKNVTQKRHDQGFEGFVTTEKRGMPGAFQDDIVDALGGVQDRPHFT